MLSVYGESLQKLKKKFARRTALFTWLWCTAILNAIEDKSGYDRVSRPWFLTQGGSDLPQIPHRPFAPHAKLHSSSEIRVSWLPVLVSSKQAVRYELFSGDDPEYVGYDLIYIAKRLKPGAEYKFKVRACSVTGCSDFSMIRSCRTSLTGAHDMKMDGKRPFFGKRRIFLILLPPLAIVTFVTTFFIFIIYIWKSLRYYLWQCSVISLDATVQKKYTPDKIFFLEHFHFDVEKGERQTEFKESDASFVQLTETHPPRPEKEDLLNLEDSPSTDRSSDTQLSASNNSQLLESCRSPGSPKAPRTRSSSLCIREESEEINGTRIRSVSDGEMFTKRTQNEPVVNLKAPLFKSVANSDTLVVIDNSNVFIGAREAACMLNPKLRPRHVKVRLQALTEVLELGRNVTKRFVCGSSPPANESVWDVYRRLGYNIDLEDRRGKDEQRVDEQLHLCIYKAIIEMTPQTLVLASGDGSKGKSSGGTSFPDCVSAAIDHGWNVEVHSWKHSLSAEWLKIAAKHKKNFKIRYLDENISKITSVDTRMKIRDRAEDHSREQRDSDRFRA